MLPLAQADKIDVTTQLVDRNVQVRQVAVNVSGLFSAADLATLT